MLGVYPSGLHDDVEVGGRILVDDGAVALLAIAVEGTEVTCEVIDGGKITEPKGGRHAGTRPRASFPRRQGQGRSHARRPIGADFVASPTSPKAHDINTARRLLIRDGSARSSSPRSRPPRRSATSTISSTPATVIMVARATWASRSSWNACP